MDAIQVLESVDECIKTGQNFENVKKIKIKSYPSLKNVLLSENRDTRNWKCTTVPNCFPWKNGIHSITRGLWICPKIFRLKDRFKNEVGVMLMDMEGMFDGEATDGEIVAMSGVSAAISFLQMFNMKEKITNDYLESVIRNLIKGIEEFNGEEGREVIKDNYKLMLVVRDWIGEDSYPFGTVGGEDYIKKEATRGTRQYQNLWQLIHNTFQQVDCVLLPDPGREVSKSHFNQSGDLSLLDEVFLNQVEKLFRILFEPDNLSLPANPLTGKGIYDILTAIDGKIADEKLSFLYIFTENANANKMEEWIDQYREMLSGLYQYSGLSEAKSEMSNILRKAERKFIGVSKMKYLEELKQSLEEMYNKKVIDFHSEKYEEAFQEYPSTEKQHHGTWSSLTSNLRKYLCGDTTTKNNAYLIFIKKTAAFYYRRLHEEYKRRFKHECSSKKKLEECAGLDERELKNFKECEDFLDGLNNEEVHPLWLKEYQSLKREIRDILLETVGKICGINIEVLQKLRRKQYEHFESFTLLNKNAFNLDSVDRKEKLVIAKKVGYAMFEPSTPLTTPSTDATMQVSALLNKCQALIRLPSTNKTANDQNTGYTKEQESKIWPVVNKIIQLSSSPNVEFSCIFVVYQQDENTVNVPVFRVKMPRGFKYVDSNCREYSDWDHFLKTNTLPDVVFCYPLNGMYIKSEGFGVAYSKAPASKPTEKFLEAGDVVGKGVSGVAGIAAGAAVCGVAAPAVAITAVAGGVVGGAYGLYRSLSKIMDKREHGETVTKKDMWNVAVNALTVVASASMAAARTVTTVVEGAQLLVYGARAAAGFTSMCSLAALFSSLDDTSELIKLISEVEESSLQILFYFGTTCSVDALNVIRRCLNLDNNASTVETLIAVLENNCIEYATETDTERTICEKYISENVAKLVTSILTVVSSDVKDTVLDYCKLHLLYDQCHGRVLEGKEALIRENLVAENIHDIMEKLLEKLQHEVDVSKVRFTKGLCECVGVFSAEFIQLLLEKCEKKGGHYLILAFRVLIWSFISGIRKANKFFNTIEHDAIVLEDHHLNDVLCHPLSEISQQVREMVHQTETAVDFSSTDTEELDYFILKIFQLLSENMKETWSAVQIARCLEKMNKDIVSGFDRIVSKHKQILDNMQNKTCHDLRIITDEIGLEGYNYGNWVGKKVLSEVKVDSVEVKVDAVDMFVGRQSELNLFLMPGWSGVLDHLYYYYSDQEIKDKKKIFEKIERITDGNYRKSSYESSNLTIYTPSTGHDMDLSEMNSFVVYSKNRQDGFEEGFVWLKKNITVKNEV